MLRRTKRGAVALTAATALLAGCTQSDNGSSQEPYPNSASSPTETSTLDATPEATSSSSVASSPSATSTPTPTSTESSSSSALKERAAAAAACFSPNKWYGQSFEVLDDNGNSVLIGTTGARTQTFGGEFDKQVVAYHTAGTPAWEIQLEHTVGDKKVSTASTTVDGGGGQCLDESGSSTTQEGEVTVTLKSEDGRHCAINFPHVGPDITAPYEARFFSREPQPNQTRTLRC